MQGQRFKWALRCRFLRDAANWGEGAAGHFLHGTSFQWGNRSHQPRNKVMVLKHISRGYQYWQARESKVQDRYGVSPLLKSINKVTVWLGWLTAAKNPASEFQWDLYSGRMRVKKINRSQNDMIQHISSKSFNIVKTGKCFHEVLVNFPANNQGSRSKIKTCQGQPTGF